MRVDERGQRFGARRRRAVGRAAHTDTIRLT
jgi:hypothetical protein